MAENKYWFARRFPVGHPRNAMSPVSPEGWAVAKAFMTWMIGGAIAAIVLVALGGWSAASAGFGPLTWILFVLAPVVFVGCSIYGGWYFISQAQGRGDHQHTIDDYKNGRVT